MEEAAAAAADCGAQFRAAVQVIQGLPRSGSYRPSYEEMLRFYSYYKQATAGRCQGPRPGFWDPIGRYKWDAWHSLGRMSKEEAMAAYVAEMKKVAQKVIDTVPMDETTEEMFGYFEPLYEVIHDMPRPPEAFFKRKRGGGLAPAAEALEGSQVTSDSEGDVYCDTLELMEPEQAGWPLGLSPDGIGAGPEPPMPRGTRQGERGEGRRGEGRSGAGLAAHGSERDLQLAGGEQDAESTQGLPDQLDTHVAGTVRALQDDMRRVLERLSELETLASAQGDAAGTDPGRLLAPRVSWRWWHEGCDKDHRAVTVACCHWPFSRGLGGLSGHCLVTPVPPLFSSPRCLSLSPRQETSPWPLTVSPRTLLFLIAWPFVTQWLLRRWQGKMR
ncbi:acyl-CoA-binding domain-containing protein 4 isoform X2 [Rissa tridactyla]|uniref:acyl-CoA-binding domain-containing protein 4 isoform X2 n=1 Tax=Rissa tridactyla TaxID=75485 RepID=UPI0023BA6071|nr:acyl-CoA-binding domain-containing protein 4 isoform X2 [Rissa tridactyla]